MELKDCIKQGKLKVMAKPNAAKTEFLGFDEARQAARISIAAVPDKDKANTELLKFLKKETGMKCELISGARSREKVIRFL
ncbi:DUF167 domain-containing protein [Candidatus Woesearchaeota archaeon]|nr:DUF167 domain-containing protein [Candidatus Woesearchaeota archaeon]